MSTAPETWTVLRLLKWTTDFLKRYDVPSPRLDAEILLAEAMGCTRVDLYTRFEYEPTPQERETFKAAIRKRSEGVPVAYLVGHKEFYSLDFLVDPGVLIPRPETEFLIVGLFDLVKERFGSMDAEMTICDVGTGSGILPITAALNLKNARVLGVDISPEALAVAQKNVEKYADRLGGRVVLGESDLFSRVSDATRFDFIISNPPYVGRREIDAELETNVYRYEPHVALFGGEVGTELIARLLPDVPKHLKDGGFFLMELSPMIHAAVVELIGQTPSLEYVKTIRDLDQQERIVAAKKSPR